MTARQSTQCERVDVLLRRAGRHGVTQLDADSPFDGGPPIRRLASRIRDLRERGYVIESTGRRNKLAVYILVSKRQVDDGPGTVGADHEALFEAAATATRTRGPYDAEERFS
jgi:hypothetical protein